MASIKLQRIHNQIRNELFTFRNELNKLSVPNYPTSTCKEIIESLERKLDSYEDALVKIMGDIEDDDPKILEEAINKLITYIHNPLIIQDVKFLAWLSKAQTRKVPWSFIKCIEAIAQDIIPDPKLLVCCEDHYNYGICWSNSEKLAPFPYYVLSLPSLHRTDILWHTLIGHELFHPRCSEFINKHNQSILTSIKDKVKIYVTENYKKFIPEELSDEDLGPLFIESFKNKRIISISSIVHEVWRRGLEELLSDMACIEIFGPSAILAMNSFSACSINNELPAPDNNFYPPWNYRFETVWNNFIDNIKLNSIYSEIGDENFYKSFKEEMESIGDLVKESAGRELVKSHSLANIAYAEIDKLIADAAIFVKESLKDTVKWYDEDVIKQIPDLIQRLSNGIPPSEVICEIDENEPLYKTIPAKIPAIFLAGWIYECSWQQNLNNEQKTIEKYMTISRLLLKACEDTEIIRRIQGCQS